MIQRARATIIIIIILLLSRMTCARAHTPWMSAAAAAVAVRYGRGGRVRWQHCAAARMYMCRTAAAAAAWSVRFPTENNGGSRMTRLEPTPSARRTAVWFCAQPIFPLVFRPEISRARPSPHRRPTRARLRVHGPRRRSDDSWSSRRNAANTTPKDRRGLTRSRPNNPWPCDFSRPSVAGGSPLGDTGTGSRSSSSSGYRSKPRPSCMSSTWRERATDAAETTSVRVSRPLRTPHQTSLTSAYHRRNITAAVPETSYLFWRVGESAGTRDLGGTEFAAADPRNFSYTKIPCLAPPGTRLLSIVRLHITTTATYPCRPLWLFYDLPSSIGTCWTQCNFFATPPVTRPVYSISYPPFSLITD